MVAVPFVLALKVMPLGSVPDSVSTAVGVPVVVTVKLNAVPTFEDAETALVKAGAALLVRVNACVGAPALLVAVIVIG